MNSLFQRILYGAYWESGGSIVRHFCLKLRKNRFMLFEKLCSVCISMFLLYIRNLENPTHIIFKLSIRLSNYRAFGLSNVFHAKSGRDWPSGSWEEVEYVNSLQKDRQTTDDRWSEKLPFAISLGKLKWYRKLSILFSIVDFFFHSSMRCVSVFSQELQQLLHIHALISIIRYCD